MPQPPVMECLDQLLSLQTCIFTAIQDQDLEAALRFNEEVAHLHTEMDEYLQKEMEDPAQFHVIPGLADRIQSAMDQVHRNRLAVTGWIEATQTEMKELYRAADAARKYNAPGLQGSIYMEQEA